MRDSQAQDAPSIQQDPRFLPIKLRDEVFYALGNAVVAFKDKDAYSIDCGGYNAVSGIIFWITRIRTHLAPGLDRAPEELAFKLAFERCRMSLCVGRPLSTTARGCDVGVFVCV